MIIAVESWDQIKDEFIALSVDHYREIALNQDKIPLDPDYDKYKSMGDNHSMIFISVRDNGKLIGYAFWMICQHLHYKSTRWAYNDIIYLDPKYRRSGLGLKLIKASEQVMIDAGAKKIAWHVKVTNDWTPILARLGYIKEDIVMGKVV